MSAQFLQAHIETMSSKTVELHMMMDKVNTFGATYIGELIHLHQQIDSISFTYHQNMNIMEDTMENLLIDADVCMNQIAGTKLIQQVTNSTDASEYPDNIKIYCLFLTKITHSLEDIFNILSPQMLRHDANSVDIFWKMCYIKK